MKKITTVVGLFILALLAFSLPATAAKPASNTNQMTTTRVVSVADGSEWILLQASRISQPGNALWYVSWRNADNSGCEYTNNGYEYAHITLGSEGTQTGATWGPTSYVFAWAGGSGASTAEARLQLGEATPNVVDLTWIGPWGGSMNGFTLRNCNHGVLMSSQPGKEPVVLDNFVPLPWSVL